MTHRSRFTSSPSPQDSKQSSFNHYPCQFFNRLNFYLAVVLSSLAIATSTQSAVAADGTNCTASECNYSVPLDKPGFYTVAVTLPAGQKEGLYNLLIDPSVPYAQAPFVTHANGFLGGGLLQENGQTPSWLGFSLFQFEPVNVTVYNHSSFTPLDLILTNNSRPGQTLLKFGPILATHAQTYTVPALEPGFYTASVSGQPSLPKTAYSISVGGNSVFGGISGGWLDSNNVGWGGFYATQPRTVNLKVQFGNAFGDMGAGLPNIQIYSQKIDNSPEVYWSSLQIIPLVKTSSVISPDGGMLSIPNISTISFPAGAFLEKQLVEGIITSDSNTDLVFNETTKIFGIDSRLSSYELRITTGQVQPLTDIQVTVTIPPELSANMSPDSEIKAFGQNFWSDEIERLDTFELLDSNFSETASTLTVTVPPWIFTNERNTTGTFEAIITIGTVSGTSQSARSIFSDQRSLRADNECGDVELSPPLDGNLVVNSPYGERTHPKTGEKKKFHNGVDYAAQNGTPLKPMSTGTVVETGYQYDSKKGTGWGNYVVIEYSDGSKSKYAHLQDGSTTVKKGDTVTPDQIVANADSTGGVTGPHLHLEYMVNGKKVNPANCIGKVKPKPKCEVEAFIQKAIPTSGTTPLTVNLEAKLPDSGANPNYSYSWSASDGQKAEGVTTSMTFNTVGTYTITLTVKDGSTEGCSQTSVEKTVTVTGEPSNFFPTQEASIQLTAIGSTTIQAGESLALQISWNAPEGNAKLIFIQHDMDIWGFGTISLTEAEQTSGTRTQSLRNNGSITANCGIERDIYAELYPGGWAVTSPIAESNKIRVTPLCSK